MGAHTPGPWEVVQHHHVDDELWLSVNQHTDSQGMKPWIAEVKYLTTKPEEQWANARLIAAAPELLAALLGLIEIGKRDLSNPKYDGYFDSAREAIAKATGTTP